MSELNAACLFLCGLAIGFTGTLILALLRLLRRQLPPLLRDLPPIVILRPLEGAEPGLLGNLVSSATAPYPAARRVLLLVPDEENPAHEVAQQAAQAMTGEGVSAEVVLTGISTSGNRKVAQLMAGLARSDEEIIVQVDSDVLLKEQDLSTLVATLLHSHRHGAAFAAPVEVAPLTLPDRASAALLGSSTQSFLALFALTDLLGGVPTLAGALCAFRRSALDKIGGLAPLAEYLGEDYEVARRLLEHGYTVALAPCQARCMDGGRDARSVVKRVSRWMMVVRSQRKGLLLSYPLLLGAMPLFVVLTLLLRDAWLLGATVVLLVLRTALAMLLRRTQGLRGVLPALRDVALAELLLWAALLPALLRRTFEWRGHRYRIGRKGRLVQIRTTEP